MYKKSKLANLIFKILVKGVAGAYKYDTRVQSELNSLPDGFTVSMSIFPYGKYITFKKYHNSIYKVDNNFNADLVITFKNIKNAKKVLLGKQSVAQSFSNHAILLKGDIFKAMALVRVINIVEDYLFPRFYTKAIVRGKKEFCSLKLYWYLITPHKKPKHST